MQGSGQSRRLLTNTLCFFLKFNIVNFFLSNFRFTEQLSGNYREVDFNAVSFPSMESELLVVKDQPVQGFQAPTIPRLKFYSTRSFNSDRPPDA